MACFCVNDNERAVTVWSQIPAPSTTIFAMSGMFYLNIGRGEKEVCDCCYTAGRLFLLIVILDSCCPDLDP